MIPANALKCALDAAEIGARILLEGYGRHLEIHHKGAIDLVTEYDLRSEEAVRKIIGREFPDHLIVGEEEGRSGQRQSSYRWYIDPLDGTTNYTNRHPFFAVSIGLFGPDAKGVDRPLVGVINAPVLGELFWGSRGGGAYRRQNIFGRGLVESKLAVTNCAEIGHATLNTGFPYNVSEEGGRLTEPFARVVRAARAVRRAGAASLDLAYVAAGIADGYWETGLKAWDAAAGVLLVNEAGGLATDYDGRDYEPEKSPNIVAAGPSLHEILRALVNPPA